ncbi:hypothetical protein TWF694_003029 [Orbilia ellipsospora]|uniref:Yeast cell wall synthesis Kre9/Knh1-like N-terminal domain-containing protein n=1 Tax=Orbilia ellipsospora TaxID=2528407 RepID=A0AAV9X1A0_9PEZI
MRFNIFSLLSLASITVPFVVAQAGGVENNENVITAPAAGAVLKASTPFDIIWTPTANPGTVSIVLVKGVPGNLQVLETIAPNVANNGKFEWNPPVSLQGLQTMGDQIYEFKIVNDVTGNFGFSPQFKIDSPASTFVATTGTTGASSAAPTTSSASVPATTSVSSALTTDATSSSATSSASVTSSSVETSSVTSTSASSASTSVSTSATSAPTTLATSTVSSSSQITASPTTSSASSSSASASSSATSDPNTQPPATKPGLSKGAIAGITAGVIGAIVLGILVVFFLRRRKQHSRSKLVGSNPAAPSKYDRDFQMMERRARHRPTSSFGFNTSRSDTSGGVGDRNDPYVPLNDRDSTRHNSGTWNGSRF